MGNRTSQPLVHRPDTQSTEPHQPGPVLSFFWLSHESGGPRTWNWALMLGGFFFLCRCSRDLVVRSCRVILMMSFRDLESSRF